MRIRAAFALAAFAGVAAGASAAPIVLSDVNSTTVIDPAGAGQSSWQVDGVHHLYQQWFWYRIGNTPEANISTLPLTGISVNDTNPFTDAAHDTLALQYQVADLIQIEPTFVLRGGNVGTFASDVAEIIRITNLTNQIMPFSFFQYANFDLNGTLGDDSVFFASNNDVFQTDPIFSMHETVIAPTATRIEANYFANTFNKLNDAFVDNLDNVAAAGPGDVTWAFQWDFLLLPGQTVIISKDKQIVPTPGAFALVGAAGLFGLRRRR